MLVNDGFANFVASLGNGVGKDKASYGGWHSSLKTPEQYEEIYRASAFGRKIVDIPIEDMTRRWRGWNAPEPHVEAMEAAEKRHKLRQRVTEAARWARLYGSAAILIHVDPRLGEPDTPLDVSRMRQGDLISLRVETFPSLQINEWERDYRSPIFGQPSVYLYQPRSWAAGAVGEGQAPSHVRIHASRVIPFSGKPFPPAVAYRYSWWGESVLAALEDQLNTAGSILSVIASLVYESKVDIVGTNLEALATPEGEARLKRRFELVGLMKSINNTILKDREDTYDQRKYDFAGLPDIHTRILQELSGAADIPATRFLSQAPAGLQATGESDYRNYADMISGKQETDLRPAIEYLDPILIADAGIKPDKDAYWFFHPLWQESAKEKAENFYKFAQGTKLISDTGAVPEDALRKGIVSRLVEDGVYPALDDAMEEFEAAARELRNIPEGEPGEDDDEPAETNVVPLRRTVTQDATPRTLYVSRKLKNAGDVLDWARSQGIPNLMPAGDLHATIAYSRTPLDWMTVGQPWTEEVKVPAGGPRVVEPIGGQGAAALLFASWDLESRHKEIREAGASWDHDGYQAHVTLTWDAGDTDMSKVVPYNGPLVFGPEVFEEVVENWREKVEAAE